MGFSGVLATTLSLVGERVRPKTLLGTRSSGQMRQQIGGMRWSDVATGDFCCWDHDKLQRLVARMKLTNTSMILLALCPIILHWCHCSNDRLITCQVLAILWLCWLSPIIKRNTRLTGFAKAFQDDILRSQPLSLAIASIFLYCPGILFTTHHHTTQ